MRIEQRILVLLIGFVFLSGILSCDKMSDVALQNSFDDLGVSIVDTFNIVSSTYQLDPLPTAATGRMLVGELQDPDMGMLSASTYFRVLNNSIAYSSIPQDVQYDSLTLELYYDGYSYGDTTQRMLIQVHRVTEEIELEEPSVALEDDEYPVFVSGSNIYADKSFGREEAPLGQILFYPKPTSGIDTINIRLDDELGEELFQMMIDQDNRLSDATEFLNYFKGLYLQSAGVGNAVIGLSDSISLSLHYSHENQSSGLRENSALVFGMGSTSYQFNHIDVDRSHTPISSLNDLTNELLSSSTNGVSYLQGGLGMVVRLKIPHLREFVGAGNYVVSKAVLVLETQQDPLGKTPPPSSLVLMEADSRGTPTSLIQDRDGNTVGGTYLTGNGSSGRYEFDVTNYVASSMLSDTYDENNSLFVSLPTSSLLSSVDALKVSSKNQTQPVKIQLWYVTYD